jgi:hypothetical protein
MPVVLRVKGYPCFFYEVDLNELPHVHVAKQGSEAKCWVNPIGLAKSRGFREHELNEIATILAERQEESLQVWQREQEKRGHSQGENQNT